MSMILVLCVIAAAVWVAVSMATARPRAASKDSVEAFSRALSALSPDRVPQRARVAPARRRPAPRQPTRH